METIERYKLVEEIGSGGMGVVYRALDTSLDREVALKLLPPQLKEYERFASLFQQEARIIAQLEHPHIVPVYDVGIDQKRPFFVMRLLRGGTLRDKLKQGKLTIQGLWRIMSQVAQGLDGAHGQGIIHRDIKPTNILFDERETAVISDFGLARIATITTSGTSKSLSGTPAYMSPEQCTDGQVDGRSDQYGLAVLIFEALTGQLPFAGEPLQVMYKHVNSDPPEAHLLNPRLPPVLSQVLRQALAKSPALRFATVSEFVAALEGVTAPEAAALPLPVNAQAEPKTPTETAVAPPTTAVDHTWLNQQYELGLVAMDQRNWQEAFDYFDTIVQQDRYFRSALTLRRTVERHLQAASANSARAAPPLKPSLAPEQEPTQSSLSHSASKKPKVILGAGGNAPERIKPTVRQKWVLPAFLFLLALSISLTAFIFWPDPPPTEEQTTQTTAVAPPALPDSNQSITLRVPQSAPDATWQPEEMAVPIPATGQLDVPLNGRVVSFHSGSGIMQLLLPNDSLLYLAPQTSVDLVAIEEWQLILKQGQLLIHSNGVAKISNEFGAFASVRDGLLGVIFNKDPFRFDADCLQSLCTLTGDLQGEQPLSPGQYSYVGGSGSPAAPQPARYELYAFLTDIVPTPKATATPTNTPTATATNRPATATERPSATPRQIIVSPTTPTPTDTPTIARTPAPTASRTPVIILPTASATSIILPTEPPPPTQTQPPVVVPTPTEIPPTPTEIPPTPTEIPPTPTEIPLEPTPTEQPPPPP